MKFSTADYLQLKRLRKNQMMKQQKSKRQAPTNSVGITTDPRSIEVNRESVVKAGSRANPGSVRRKNKKVAFKGKKREKHGIAGRGNSKL